MAEPVVDHRRAVAERNLEAILDAAEGLLERQAALSIAAVAKESGVSRVTVYAHFATLEELVEALVTRAVHHATRAIDGVDLDGAPPLEALDAMITSGWMELDRQSGIRRAAAAHLPPETLRRSHDELFAQVRRLVERGRTSGDFRTDLPAEWLLTSCFALIHAAADDVREGRMTSDDALLALTTTVREIFAAG
jgi:AcrR family transcriptional regulator